MRVLIIGLILISAFISAFSPNFLVGIKNEVKSSLSFLQSDEKKKEITYTEKKEKDHEYAFFLYVVDGDTINVNLNGVEERVRLLMVNTPETKNVTTPEPYGPEASVFTKNFFLNAETITLEYDKEKRDPYGRLLAYVYNNGVMLNEELLKNGLAEVTIYGKNNRYEERFYNLQNEAISKKIGLWSD